MSESLPDSATTQESRKSSFSREPLVFISHDTRDAELAEAFSKLLSGVSAGVLKTFRSSDKRGMQGMEYGVEWYPEIMSRLDKASDVVCLLTERSIDRPWILYEAGVAKGKLGVPVLGLVLGIPLQHANTGPFAQFQNIDDDPDSIAKLVMQLLGRVPNAEPEYEVIEGQVAIFRDKTSEILDRLSTPSMQAPAAVQPTDGEATAKLFEEVKVMFKDLPLRLESRFGRGQAAQIERQQRTLSSTVFDIAMSLGKRNYRWGLLYVASLLRDECPWLYEVGLDIYRELPPGKRVTVYKAALIKSKIRRFVELAKATLELGMLTSESDSYQFWSDLPSFLDWYSDRLVLPVLNSATAPTHSTLVAGRRTVEDASYEFSE